MKRTTLWLTLCGLLGPLLLLPASAHGQPAGAGVADFLKHRGSVFVLENARLVDGTGAPAREQVTVVIENGLITHVGGPPAAIPDGAERIDLSGQTILPGLVMMHEHINYFSGAFVWDAMPGSVPKLLLAAGVTTARTAGAEAPQIDLNLRERLDAGRAPGPRLSVTGAYLNGASGGFLGDTVTRTPEQARAAVAYWGSLGASSIKVYSAIAPEVLQAAVEEANRRGMHVAGHLGEISCTEAASAGIHTIEHSLTSCATDLGVTPETMGTFRYRPEDPRARRLIAMLVERDVVLVATPTTTAPYDPTPEELAMLNPEQRERYEALVRDPPAYLPSPAAMTSWNAAHRAFERDFVAAGGRLLIGGDASDFGVVPGYANHRAMIALAEAGFTPLQVIRFATSDAAAFLGFADRGIVAPGKVADLLIVEGAPDRRLADIRNVRTVFRGGLAYDPARLRQAATGQLGSH